MLGEDLARNGLRLESVSLTRLDQTPFHALDENNAFNALGMRRLAEIIATNQKERAAIEADAEVSVHQSRLDATKRRLLLSQEEEEATISQQREIETARGGEPGRHRGGTVRVGAPARGGPNRPRARGAPVRDRARPGAASPAARCRALDGDREGRQRGGAGREAHRAGGGRDRGAGGARPRGRGRGGRCRRRARPPWRSATRPSRSSAPPSSPKWTTPGSAARPAPWSRMAEAQARATLARASSEKDELLARARGTAALIEAENAQSPALIGLKLDRARIEALPGIVEKMMKPAEKIESIRINHITGLGPGASDGGGGTGGNGTAVDQVVDGMLKLALQLPGREEAGRGSRARRRRRSAGAERFARGGPRPRQRQRGAARRGEMTR